jgi:hypothetical protein
MQKGSYIYAIIIKYLDFVAEYLQCWGTSPKIKDGWHILYGEYSQSPAVEYCKLLASLPESDKISC